MEPKNKDNDKDAEQYSGWWLLGIAALGAFLCALLFFVSDWTSGRNGIEKLGQMGDFFGGMLNPLVSALTLFVAISVWQLQKKELQATQKALDEQAKTAEQQRQEQRFFDLMNVYQQTLESITHIEKRQLGHQEAHRFGKQAMTAWIHESKVDQPSDSTQSDSEFMAEQNPNFDGRSWEGFDRSGMFDHYIRVIIHILTEAEALLGDQHIRYIKLFRAQLSRSELIILGSNLWRQDAQDTKITHLAEKYGLLKHLPKGHLRTELEKLHPKVFGHQPEANQ